jgi:RNA polymerase sigma-70 factor (ECF subfamily)
MSEPAIQPDLDPAGLFGAHRRRVWGLAYRLTGTAEDADDVVQETFARLLERSPGLEPRAAGAWLARVATHLAIDALRRRRRRAYPGPWLPAAVEAPDADWLDGFPSPDPDAGARYELLESATTAFLLALEALGPRQRAVLVLRDVLGHSAADTAGILGTSEGNVRVLHLRARRALADYDRERCRPGPELRARHREALERFLGCLLAQDAGALEALLSESVRTLTDAGGAYTALAAPMSGRSRVARFYLRAAAHRREGGPSIEVRLVNGLPAALIRLAHPVRRQAPRSVLSVDLDADGRIRTVLSVLAPRKLRAVRFDAAPA